MCMYVLHMYVYVRMLEVNSIIILYLCATATDRWYQRWENNGWRLVSDRVSISLRTFCSCKSVRKYTYN